MHCQKLAAPGLLNRWGSRLGLALLLVVSLPMMVRADIDIAALQPKANAGDPEAQFELGVDYRWGLGGKRDEAEAVRWYRKAADQGHAQAQVSLANCYHYGIGAEKDKKKARHWLKKAAKQR
jgi:TPR repeat protein